MRDRDAHAAGFSPAGAARRAGRLAAPVSTFALVHGAWHGGWCWERLTPELERRGHRRSCGRPAVRRPRRAVRPTTPTVVVERPRRTRGTTSSSSATRSPATRSRSSPRGRPVRRLVFLCALIAQPGASSSTSSTPSATCSSPATRPGSRRPTSGRCAAAVDFAIARRRCTRLRRGRRRAAFDRLRPQASTPYFAPCSLDAFPDVPATYVVAAEDRIVNPAWSRRAAAERLGVEAIELPGGHSPYLVAAGGARRTSRLAAQRRSAAWISSHRGRWSSLQRGQSTGRPSSASARCSRWMCQPASAASVTVSFGAGVVTVNVSAVPSPSGRSSKRRHPVRLGVELEEARRVERGHRARWRRLVALVVGVQPAQPHAAALDEVDFGVGEPAAQLAGLGDRRPAPGRSGGRAGARSAALPAVVGSRACRRRGGS